MMTEIFEKLFKADTIRQKHLEIKELEQDNFRINNQCGSCSFWMTQRCPREANNHKVSCGEIKCQKFDIQPHYSKLIQDKKGKIHELGIEISTLINQPLT